MVRQVDHINLVVTDLARSVRFYTALLGLRETRRAHLEGAWIERIVGLPGVVAEVVFLQPDGGGPRLELLQYQAPLGVALPANRLPHTVGLRHIAFQVTDIDAMCARLAAAGVALVSPPVVVPGGVVRHDDGQKRLCYFHDPDGVLLELAEYRPGPG
jgi:catechol 2,3-dioxygenase-like lactoylglutathione lyase family enzyme